jgi:hypothetical protein
MFLFVVRCSSLDVCGGIDRPFYGYTKNDYVMISLLSLFDSCQKHLGKNFHIVAICDNLAEVIKPIIKEIGIEIIEMSCGALECQKIALCEIKKRYPQYYFSMLCEDDHIMRDDAIKEIISIYQKKDKILKQTTKKNLSIVQHFDLGRPKESISNMYILTRPAVNFGGDQLFWKEFFDKVNLNLGSIHELETCMEALSKNGEFAIVSPIPSLGAHLQQAYWAECGFDIFERKQFIENKFKNK